LRAFLQACAEQKRCLPRLRESASNSPPHCRHLDEEREPATGRKKTSPSRQAEDQITTGEAPVKKTGRKGRNAGAQSGRKRAQEHGKTVVFKPATFSGFQNDANKLARNLFLAL
jgi:hypothetical protein